jgi:hypothetical protein
LPATGRHERETGEGGESGGEVRAPGVSRELARATRDGERTQAVGERDGGDTDPATDALEGTLAGFPDVKLHTESEFVTSRTKESSTLLKLLYVLLAFSVVVSLFGW